MMFLLVSGLNCHMRKCDKFWGHWKEGGSILWLRAGKAQGSVDNLSDQIS